MSELIAFIGVGNMGNPMAQNLVKAGKKVKVFDVSKNMIEKAREKKLEVVENLDDLITNEVTTVITILMPEVKIKIDQLKKTKRVCPMSGWTASNRATNNVIKKVKKYFK